MKKLIEFIGTVRSRAGSLGLAQRDLGAPRGGV